MTLVSPPRQGVYAPTLTFFHADGRIDIEATVDHALWLAKSNLAGLVIMGSNGEAPLVEREERHQIISAIRRVLRENEIKDTTLIVGCGAQSLRATVALIEDAKEAGADFALVLPPSYWPPAMTKPVLLRYYDKVCAQSSLPVLAYNFPLVAAGINLTSDDLLSLAKRNAKLVGAKLTCGNIGTAHRVASRLGRERFAVLAGKAEFSLHALVAGSSGTIAALANVAPRSLAELHRLFTAGDLSGAVKVQTLLADADWQVSKLGVAGLKAIVCAVRSLSAEKSIVRSPLVQVETSAVAAMLTEDDSPLRALLAFERELAV